MATRPWLRSIATIAKGLGIFLLWNLGIVPVLLLPPVASAAWMAVLIFAFYRVLIARNLGEGRAPQRTLLRLRPPGAAVPWALAAALPLFVLGVSSAAVFTSIGHAPTLRGAEFLEQYAHRPWGWLPLSLLAVVFAPLLEELVFRGYVQRTLERRLGPIAGIAAAAAVFGFAHGLAIGNVSRFLMGLVLGAAVYMTGSIWTSVILHAMNNGIVMILAPLADRASARSAELLIQGSGRLGFELLGLSASVAALLLLGLRARREIPAPSAEPPATEPPAPPLAGAEGVTS